MTDSENLDSRQVVTMSTAARQRLRAKAVELDVSHGPFSRVLLAAGLEEMEVNQDFSDRVVADVESEKQRYKKD